MRAGKAATMLTSLVKVGLFAGRVDVSSQIHLLRAKIVAGLNNGRPIADHRHPKSSSAKKIYQIWLDLQQCHSDDPGPQVVFKRKSHAAPVGVGYLVT
jgi:hypothetical protein